MTFGLFSKCYAANVVHVHLISIGTMLKKCLMLLNKNAGDMFKYYILEKLISSEAKLCR